MSHQIAVMKRLFQNIKCGCENRLPIKEGDLAEKQDIKNLETKIDNLAERLEYKVLQSEYRFTIKVGLIVTILIAAATAVIKLL